ncbi:MAG TPA: hypothetical protein VFX28_10050 [Methylomirabilota bacterium]|nr:hypothetical protein [Methylomirabilota bacterium]
MRAGAGHAIDAMNASRSLAPSVRIPFAAAALAVALAGCGADRASAPRVADATLEATLVRLADGSVSVHAVAMNTGRVPIMVGAICAGISIEMTVHGPNCRVQLPGPCVAEPMCPPGFLPLAPGERVERLFTYDGRQWAGACDTSEAIPPGRYEVAATFGWYAKSPPLTTLTRRLPFDWPAP